MKLTPYKPKEELFVEAIVRLDESTGAKLEEHPAFMRITAAASTFIAAGAGDLSEHPHEMVLSMGAALGFAFDTHEEARLVALLTHWFQRVSRAQQEALRAQPFRNFEGFFFRDRRGRLKARFSMGSASFLVDLTEEFEHQFVLVVQEALVRRLNGETGEEEDDAIREPTDGESADDEGA
jgi:hypothetical protein